MLLNWCCSLNIFNAEKSVGGDVKKSTTSSFFNRITFHLAVWCKNISENKCVQFEIKILNGCWKKTAKNVRAALFCRTWYMHVSVCCRHVRAGAQLLWRHPSMTKSQLPNSTAFSLMANSVYCFICLHVSTSRLSGKAKNRQLGYIWQPLVP